MGRGAAAEPAAVGDGVDVLAGAGLVLVGLAVEAASAAEGDGRAASMALAVDDEAGGAETPADGSTASGR